MRRGSKTYSFCPADQVVADVQRLERRVALQRLVQARGTEVGDLVFEEDQLGEPGVGTERRREDLGPAVADEVGAQVQCLQDTARS